MADDTINVKLEITGDKAFLKACKDIKDALWELSSELQDVSDKFKDMESALDNAKTEIKETETELKRLAENLEDVKKKSEEAGKAFSDSVKEIGKDAGIAVNAGFDIGDAFSGISSSISNAAGNAISSLDGIVSQVSTTETSVGSAASGMGVSIGGLSSIALVVVDAIAKIGKEMYEQKRNIEIATAEIRGMLGLTEEESEALIDVAKKIYVNGYADSFENAKDAVITTKGYLRDLNDTELENIAKQANLLSDTFGVDLGNVIRTASKMMIIFDMDAQSALNTIEGLMQQNPDQASAFLDVLDEYSNKFENAGFSALEFAGILAAGEDARAYPAEIADAYTELINRINDGSDTTKEALSNLFAPVTNGREDMQAEIGSITTLTETVGGLMEDVAAGGEPAKEAIQTILTQIEAMDDPLQQNMMGVALMGLQWEDVSNSILPSLSEVESKMESIAAVSNSGMQGIADATITELEKEMREIEVEGFFSYLVDTFVEEVEASCLEYGEMLENTKNSLYDLSDRYPPEMKEHADSVIKTIAGIPEEIKTGWTSFTEGLGEFLESGFAEVGENAVATSEAQAAMMDEIGESLENTWTSFVDWLVGLFEEKTPDMQSSAQGMLEDGIGGAMEASRPKHEAAGSAIVDGVWAGMKSQEGVFRRRVRRYFSSIVDDVNDELGIASPSTVFAEIGKNMMKGIGVGFNSEIVGVGQQLRTSLRSLTNGLEAEIGIAPLRANVSAQYQSVPYLIGAGAAVGDAGVDRARGVQVIQNIYANGTSYAGQQKEAARQMGAIARRFAL